MTALYDPVNNLAPYQIVTAEMGERFFRQTDEFVVIDQATGDAETAFEFTELERLSPGGRGDTPVGRVYNLRRGAQRIVLNADGTFSTTDGTRTFARA